MRWLINIKPCDQPRVRLICFPFGGGGVAAYRRWNSELPSDVELWAVCLPGREVRSAEEFAIDADQVVAAICDELPGLRSCDMAFYGHSMGAGLAVQTAQVLRTEERPAPALLIVSGRLPPHRPYMDNWAERPEPELKGHLNRIGGLPPELLNHDGFLATYLPKLRADLRLNESIPCGRLAAFDFPITTINGMSDPLIADGSLPEWQGYTNAEFQSFTLPGGHFFIQSHFKEFMCILSDQLARVA